jgi:hypothetical protein
MLDRLPDDHYCSVNVEFYEKEEQPGTSVETMAI